MTAVILRADAVLQAEMRMRSSIRFSLTSLQADWMMKTSSSRTDSEILTLISPLEKVLTVHGTRGTFSLQGVGWGDMSHWPDYKRRRREDVSRRRGSPLGHCLGELGVTVACNAAMRPCNIDGKD